MRFGSLCSGIEAASVAWAPLGRKRGNAVDHSGRIYGRLTVLHPQGRASDGHVLWICRCSCGIECVVQSNNFRGGGKGTRSCGCLHSEAVSARRRGEKPWNVGATYQNHGDVAVYSTKHAWAKAVIRLRSNRCERCGWARTRCDVHHRVPRSEGGQHTIENGEVLCPNCHREHHAGGAK